MQSHLFQVFRAGAFVVLAVCFGTAFAQPVQLVFPHSGPLSSANASGANTQAIPVQFNAVAMQSVGSGGEVDLTLPNATRYAIVFELAQPHGDGITSWIGYLKDYGKHYRAIITAGPAGTYASIQTPAGEYRLVPGSGHDWLIDMVAEQAHLPIINLGNDGVVPPTPTKSAIAEVRGEPTFMTAIPGVNTVGLSAATPTPQYVVDLMFVVTTGLADRLDGNLMTRLNFLVTRANDSYAQSEVAITMRLVYATVVDYPDTTSDSAALNAITPASGGGVGVFSNIESLRTTYGADAVAFLRNGPDFGGTGRGWIPVPTMSPYMYSVVTGCVQGCELVFIHEVGHNMGNMHDRATVAWQAGGTSSYGSGLFSYSFGYNYCESGALTCNPELPNGTAGACTSSTGPACSSSHANNFGTIMSYFNPVVYYFSNPNINCGPAGGATRPCGISELAGNSASNALSMNNNRTILSAIKSTTVTTLPGSIQFTTTVFSITEASGTLNLIVSRVGGASGAISAAYATSDGSALAGFDYTQSAGNVSWANGDTANKTISIPIVNDGVTEGGETFTVTLSNPTGATGVYLGSPSTATAIIIESWPPGGTIPAGFATPDGSSGAWTAATDQVYEGTNSLRSAQVLTGDSTFATVNNSDLSYTGNFVAGTVGFAYRVSSYQGYGIFDFLVDGSVVFSDTGETGWKLFSYNISSGSHALKWRFKNRMPSACNAGWNPPPQGGAACADRVWIDAVVLPLVLANSTTSLASSSNPSVVGQSVTFTATVSGSSGTPTGNVVFRDGGTAIAGCTSVSISGGTAQCTTTALPQGTRFITAQYSGNTTYNTSTSITFTQTVNTAATPGAPTAVSANAGSASIVVNFGAPASDGGSAITGYSATCTSSNGGVPRSNTGGPSATSIRVSGLTNGKRYTCTVTASNSAGPGPASAPSNAITPFDLTPILMLLLD